MVVSHTGFEITDNIRSSTARIIKIKERQQLRHSILTDQTDAIRYDKSNN